MEWEITCRGKAALVNVNSLPTPARLRPGLPVNLMDVNVSDGDSTGLLSVHLRVDVVVIDDIFRKLRTARTSPE